MEEVVVEKEEKKNKKKKKKRKNKRRGFMREISLKKSGIMDGGQNSNK